jgi:hypothetical protein
LGLHLGEISGFRREVDENCAFFGYYSSSGVQKIILDPWKMGPIDCPETSVRNSHYSLRNNPKERSSHGDSSWCLLLDRPIGLLRLRCLKHGKPNTWPAGRAGGVQSKSPPCHAYLTGREAETAFC